GVPVPEREAIAPELKQLRRTCDRGRERPRELCQLGGRDDPAEVVQTVEAEGLADRIRGLECECIGEPFGSEHDAVLPLEQRPAAARYRLVLVSVRHDPRILQSAE